MLTWWQSLCKIVHTKHSEEWMIKHFNEIQIVCKKTKLILTEGNQQQWENEILLKTVSELCFGKHF